jgi:integrase
MADTPVPTLAAVLTAIERNESPRRWLASRAIRILCERTGRAAADIPGDGPGLETVLASLDPATFARRHEFFQVRSEIRWAARATRELPLKALSAAAQPAPGAIPTLADAIAAVALQSWSPITRRNVVGAIEAFAAALNRLPAAIPARLAPLEREIDAKLTHLSLHVEKATYRAMRSRLRRGVRLVDRTRPIRPRDFDGEYAALWQALEQAFGKDGTGEGWRLAELQPLISFAFSRKIPLQALDDAAIVDWAQARRADPALKSPAAAIQKSVRAWNRLVGSNLVPRFPARTLIVPCLGPRHKNLRLQDLPAPFQAAWHHYETEIRATDDIVDCVADDLDSFLDDDVAPDTKLQPGTLRNHRAALLRAVTALVQAGTPLQEITSLTTVLTAEAMKTTLKSVMGDQKAKANAEGETFDRVNSYVASIAHTLAAMASSAKVSEDSLARMRAMAAKVDPKAQDRESYMGPRHRLRLEQFSDDQKLYRWFDHPHELKARAEALLNRGIITPKSLVDMEIALVARILQNIPIRRGNVGALRYYGNDPHLRMPTRERGVTALHIPLREVKNRVTIVAELDETTTDWIRLWVTHLRPVLARNVGADPHNEYLFPGHGMTHKDLSKLNSQFGARMREAGLIMNLHIARHIMALIVLSEDITLMELVSQLLGHKKPQTTKDFYAKFEKLAAQRRWHEILRERVAKLSGSGPRLKRITSPEAK